MTSIHRRIEKRDVILAAGYSFVGWGLCALAYTIALSKSSPDTAMMLHVATTPFVYAGMTTLYRRRAACCTPTQTAMIFLSVFAVFSLLTALVIQHDTTIFASILKIWIPFALVFTSTWLTGLYWEEKE